MKKTKTSFITNIAVVLFLASEAIIYYLIHVSKISSPISLRYLSIQISALFSWIFIALNLIKKEKGALTRATSGYLLGLAMICTLAADYFLVAIPEMERMRGMICFMGTQIFIFLHLISGEQSKKKRVKQLIFRITATLLMVMITFVVLGSNADSLAIISVIYYANLLTSLLFAPAHPYGGRLLCFGLILFALCDINVGLAVLNDLYGGSFSEGSIIHSILYSGVDLAWIFYLPSQALIPLPILKKEQ